MKSAFTLYLKEVKQNIITFLLIVLTVFLCLSVVSGMFLYAFTLNSSAEKYYDENQMWDVKIKSTLGFTKEDIIALTGAESVDKATAVISCDSISSVNGIGNYGTYICGIDFDAVSVNPDNIVAAPRLIKGSYPSNANSCVAIVSSALKSDIKIGDMVTLSGNTGYCTQTEFTVTGLAYSPEFSSYLKRTNEVSVDGTGVAIFVSKDAFSPEAPYTEINVTLKGAAEIKSFSRDYTLFVNSAMGPIDVVARVREQARGSGLSDEVQSDIDKLFKQYERIKAEGDKELGELDKVIKNMEKNNEETAKSLEGRKKELDTLKSFADATAGLPEYSEKLKDYNEKVLKYQSDFETYEMNKQTCEKLKGDRENLEKVYEKKAEEALKNYENAKNNTQTEYSQKWTLYTRDINSGYVVARENTGKLSVVFSIAPAVIILLSALLIVVLVLLGMQKRKKEVELLKLAGCAEKTFFIRVLPVYAAAAVIGMILSPVGMGAAPKILSKIVALTFDFKVSSASAVPYIILSTGLVLCLITVASAWIFLKMLYNNKENQVPKNLDLLKKIENLPTFLKVVLRNIYLNKFSYLYCVISVMCVTVLLCFGYNISNMENKVFENQYSKIQKYDTEVRLNPFTVPQENEAFMSLMSGKNYMSARKEITKISNGETEVSLIAVIPVETDKFYDFITLKSGRKINFNTDSVIITDGFAKLHSVKSGQEISLTFENGTKQTVKVSGICKNYVGDFVYIHPEKYAALTGIKPVENTVFIKNTDGNKVETAKLVETGAVYSVSQSEHKESSATSEYSKIICRTAIIFGMLIFSAAIFVIYKRRQGEMKALKFAPYGFLNTSLHFFTEILIVWVVGAILGVVLGLLLNIPLGLLNFKEIKLSPFISAGAIFKSLLVSFDIITVVCFANLVLRYKKTDR